jgi:hypothetical protein
VKTVTFQKLIDAISARAGIDPEIPENAMRGALLADYLEDALEHAWGFYEWEDITLTQQRPPATHTITLITASATPIGEVLKVYDADPSTTEYIAQYPFSTTDTTLVLDDHSAHTPVWVKFRLPAPAFTIAPYEPTRAYAVGDTVLHSTDCYRAFAATTGNAPTSTAHWKKQEIPAFLGEYAKTAVLAEIALQSPGLEQRGEYLSTRAEGILQTEMDKQWLRRGRYHHYTARFQ